VIIPMLTCINTGAEMDFCKRAFGAVVLSERVWTDGKRWGDRVGRIMDPAGHVWNIARRGPANG
jgi:uncharacterized glyoxalase superfamily protein PhnB